VRDSLADHCAESYVCEIGESMKRRALRVSD
jgi:hypothetical protein